MAAAHGMSYYLGFPVSKVLLDGIVVPVGFTQATQSPGFKPRSSGLPIFLSSTHKSLALVHPYRANHKKLSHKIK